MLMMMVKEIFQRKDSISLAKWTSNYPITTYGNISFSLLIYIVPFYYKINSHGDESQRKDNCFLYTFFQMSHSEDISFIQLEKKL